MKLDLVEELIELKFCLCMSPEKPVYTKPIDSRGEV